MGRIPHPCAQPPAECCSSRLGSNHSQSGSTLSFRARRSPGSSTYAARAPLPVTLYESPPSERGDRAWAVALLGFAALTVVDALGGPPNPRPASSIGGASRSSATSKRGRSHRLGGRFWSSELSLIQGRNGAADFVVGHVRRLSRGVASTDQVRKATALGIHLARGETWVSANTRGSTPNSVIAFRWQPPSVLSSLSRK